MEIDKKELSKKICEASELSNDEKSALLQLLNERKKYGLVWEDSTEEAWDRMKTEIPVLTEVEEKRIEKGSDCPNHILIEGDNLNALTALTYTHEGKIDVIYIDPPYNTGAKNWRYNNNFVDSEDGFKHSKFISFIQHRIKTARRLLSEMAL